MEEYLSVNSPVGVELTPDQLVVKLLFTTKANWLTEKLRNIDEYAFFIQFNLVGLHKQVYELCKAFFRQRKCDYLHLFAIDCKVVELRLGHCMHEFGLAPHDLRFFLNKSAKIKVNLCNFYTTHNAI